MDLAISTKGNRKFTALEFSSLSEGEKVNYKTSLKCLDCGGKAFFRKASTNSKSPCFGAKHTKKDCGKRSHSRKTSNEKGTHEVAIKIADSSKIGGLKKVNYFSNINEKIEIDSDEYDFSKNGKSENIYTLEPSKNVIKDWSLPKILRYQLNNGFDNINQTFNYKNNNIPIKDIVFNWEGMQELKEGFYCGYLWGCKNLWLNSDPSFNSKSFSILLDEKVDKEMWKSLEKKIGNWTNKVPAIVWGTPKRSKSSGKPYIIVTDITNIYFNIRSYKATNVKQGNNSKL